MSDSDADLGFSTLNDGCFGDHDGLVAAIGSGYRVVFEEYDSEGYGHHGADVIIALPDGRYVHAECGGCSCEGSGSWSIVETLADAQRLIPEWRRPKDGAK